MKTIPAILLTLAVAVPATWSATQKLHTGGASSAATSGQPAGRKLIYYQSAMHPWVKSPKAGRCTICGMELTPVFEGDAGFDAAQIVALAGDADVKAALRATTEEAVARGVFGAPTMFVGAQMFFGQDRLDFVREALA